MPYIQIDPYESSLIAARQERDACERQIKIYEQQTRALEVRIAQLTATIASLENLRGLPLAESTPDGTGTLGDLVCAILSVNVGRHLTVTQIRNVATAMGIQFEKPHNTASALTLTLRRLAAKPGSGILVNLGTHPMTFTWDINVSPPPPQVPFRREM
jgi:hypothetical protein